MRVPVPVDEWEAFGRSVERYTTHEGRKEFSPSFLLRLRKYLPRSPQKHGENNKGGRERAILEFKRAATRHWYV